VVSDSNASASASTSGSSIPSLMATRRGTKGFGREWSAAGEWSTCESVQLCASVQVEDR
jgi:hypothetical protein